MNDSISQNNICFLLNDIKDNFSGSYSCNIILNENVSILNGSAREEGNITTCIIGTKELYDKERESFWIGEAMVPIVGVFHEVYGHGCQLDKQFDVDNNLSKVLALNYYGCYASSVYYGILETDMGQVVPLPNYWNQPYEIAVQYAGVRMAYEYMSSWYGPENATTAIRAYEQFREERQSQVSGETASFSNIEELLGSMNQAFAASIYAHRDYNPELGKQLQDDLFRYAKLKDDGRYLLRVQDCKNGLKQDWMMCSVYWSDKDRNAVPKALSGISLSVDDAFGILSQPIRPKPKGRDLNLEELVSSQDIEYNGFEL